MDDTPYGGGAGMVMRVEPVVAAIESVRRPESTVILLDPVGEVFRHDRAADLALREHLVFVCPRYEGVDERIRAFVDLELSIGDYVVTGGELPALVVIDAVIRLLPGAIDDLSTAEESFSAGLLEYPQYTRPPSFRGMDVPEILDLRRSRRRRPLARGAGDRPDPRTPRPTCSRQATAASLDSTAAESLLEERRPPARRTDRRDPARAGARAILPHRSPVSRPFHTLSLQLRLSTTQGTAA